MFKIISTYITNNNNKYHSYTTIRNITNSTKVYIWGSGNEGQLGQSEIKKSGLRNTYEELKPIILNSFDHLKGHHFIKKINFGLSHSAAIESNGRLYTWGCSAYDQLGYLIDKDNKDTIQFIPKQVDTLNNIIMKDVSCGEYHTTALDEEGKVYTWGWGGSFFSGIGGLGHGDTKSQKYPKHVETLSFNGVKIAKIASSGMHTLALSDDGEIWCWGNGEFGRLGNGSSKSFKYPQPMDFFSDMDIISIAAGHAFSLALTKDGKVFGWGKNDNGQLGIGDSTGGMVMDVYSMENIPREVDRLHDIQIKEIAAGHTHAAAISEEGKLYFWGMKRDLAPTEMTSVRDENFISVDCGENYTAALTASGHIFTFGNGSSSCLGHGNRKTYPQPTMVEALHKHNVLQIACGSRHMGAIVVDRAADTDYSLRK